jgi:hypothetical protein
MAILGQYMSSVNGHYALAATLLIFRQSYKGQKKDLHPKAEAIRCKSL